MRLKIENQETKNATTHSANVTKDLLLEFKWGNVGAGFYGPDLSSGDFHVTPSKNKNELAKGRYHSDVGVKNVTHN